MKIFKGYENIEFNENTVLTVGSFDGIHKGHKSVLEDLISVSKEKSLRNLVVTFEPHPQVVLKNKFKHPIKILSTLDEKLFLLEKMGVENVWVLEFTEEFSKTSAEDFIIDYLIRKSGLKHFLLGYDHLFGNNREGNEELLKSLSEIHDFDVQKLKPLSEKDVIISSTKIRDAISTCRIKDANKMLGRNFNVLGKVIHGMKRGKQIGFPTANILPENKHKILPGNGAYVVQSEIKNKIYFGMCNIGFRPTFGDLERPLLEIHFFDLDMNLYDKVLNIEFLNFIREEKKFDVLEKLVSQLKNDKNFSFNFLKNYKN